MGHSANTPTPSKRKRIKPAHSCEPSECSTWKASTRLFDGELGHLDGGKLCDMFRGIAKQAGFDEEQMDSGEYSND